jgi:hypothetical protein
MRREKLLSEGLLLRLKAKRLQETIPALAGVERNIKSAVGWGLIKPTWLKTNKFLLPTGLHNRYEWKKAA